MNERIKQIWEDSEEIYVRYPKQVRSVSVTEQTIEKFAELIVRECIDLLPDACQSNNGCHASWVIKEHFGVE